MATKQSTSQQQHLDVSNSITLTLQNINMFTNAEGKPKPVLFEPNAIAGLEWQFEVEKSTNADGYAVLDLRVYCNQKWVKTLWMAKVQFTVNSRHLDIFYGFNNYYWTFPNVTNGPITTWPVTINVNILLVEATLKGLPPLDTNLVVKIGYRHCPWPELGSPLSVTMAVNKHSLAFISNYFRNLFFVDWKERKNGNNNEYVIMEDEDSDFDITAFKWMVYSALTMGGTNFLNDAIVANVLRLAVKYDVPTLVSYCNKFLLASADHPKMISLDLAETYNLAHLKEQCLDQINLWDFIECFDQSVDICSQLSEDTKALLSNKIAAIGLDTKAKLAHLAEQIKADEKVRASQQQQQPADLYYEDPFNNGRRNRAAPQRKGLVQPYNELVKSLMGRNAKLL